MTRDELVAWALTKGWRLDRYRHLQRTNAKIANRQERLHLSPIMARHEVKSASGDWVRLSSGYYSALSIGEDGNLKGMKR